MDQLPREGKRELICLLLFTCNYVVSVRRGFLFLWVLGVGYVILLWHSLSLPYNYFTIIYLTTKKPDIFCLRLTLKVPLIELKVFAYCNNKTTTGIFEEIVFTKC